MIAARSATQRTRQRELRLWLAECGLRAGPRRLDLETDGPRREYAECLKKALVGFGPVFTSFGRYLATRPDVLEIGDCDVLDGISDQAPPMPVEQVLDDFATKLERPPGEVFTDFDQEPFESRLLWQGHRARLNDGRRVAVRVLRPGFSADDVQRDLELLALLKSPMASRGFPFQEVVADFRRHLGQQLDFTGQAAAFEALAVSAADSDLLAVPEVMVTLSSRDVLVLEWLDGIPVGERDSDSRWQARSADLGRRLSVMWLQQTLVAGHFPVQADVLEMRDGRLALVWGMFAHLSDASKLNLWDYFRHTASHHPDQAGQCLLRELRRLGKSASEQRLHLQLRQVVPFRDGSWTERGDTVAEHMIVHWRVVRECGFAPQPHMLELYRGLYQVARRSHRLDPQGDSLHDAQDDLRWLAGWLQFRQMTDPRQLGESLESNLANLLELPQKLDDVLNLATHGGLAPGSRGAAPGASRRGANALVAVAVLALLMASFALVSTRLPELGLTREQSDALSAVVFLVLGALSLRMLGRV